MASNAVAYLTLVFRILAVLLLAASVVVIVTNSFENDGFEISFKDFMTYKYVLAVAVIGAFYTLIQIPLSVYYVCTEEKLISYSCMPDFDLYADKVIGFLLATGVGAGFAVTFELRGHLNEFFSLLEAASQGLKSGDLSKSDTKNFLNRSFIAIGFLFLGFLCMAFLSVVSSVALVIEANESSSFWDSFTSFFTFSTWNPFEVKESFSFWDSFTSFFTFPKWRLSSDE